MNVRETGFGSKASRAIGLLAAVTLAGCEAHAAAPLEAVEPYDVLIVGGMIYDGSGDAPYAGDLAIRGDRIVAVGDVPEAPARRTLDAAGLAVSPGFINLMSHAQETLLVDGRAQSDIRQGVTLEVMGEGFSWGPLGESMKADLAEGQADFRYEVAWNTLGEYLEHLAASGVSPNVASFIGAVNPRIQVLGYENRAPSPEELTSMQAIVRQAMEEGALGVASSLIYPPGYFAGTDELVALSAAAGEYGGIYATHMRNEGNALLEAIDETIEVARRAGVPAEIYHLKQAGRPNWHKLDDAIAKIESARADGLRITVDMYTYPAASTGLSSVLPPWVQEGGQDAFVARMKDPETRARLIEEMGTPTTEWEQMLALTGAENIILVGFANPELKPLTGLTLAEVAERRGLSPEETAIDLLIEDNSRIMSVYKMMSPENVARQVALPWMSFCSDSPAYATEGVFLDSMTHPRAYGSFARLLGKYVREEDIISLEEAIRRLTSFPASNLNLSGRGWLRAGYHADIVVFDPDTITDHATYEQPHRYATGVRDVFVNGVQVLEAGDHTGALPGRVVRGPGWNGAPGR